MPDVVRKYNNIIFHTFVKQVWPSLGTAVYPRMPSYVHKTCELDMHSITVALNTPNFTSRRMADLSDFGLLGEQSSPKWENPCLGRP